MDNTKTGGPAYPRMGEGFGNPQYDTPGMTLLDHFAGLAMQGLLGAGRTGAAKDFAMTAYEIAAAMIAERNRIMNEKP